MSTCHAAGCDREARPKQLMCRAHWFSLPLPLRDAIWDTYRAWSKKSASAPTRLAAMKAYRRNILEARRVIAEAEGKLHLMVLR